MAWTYVVPSQTFQSLSVQLPAGRRHEFLDRARIEIHAELTRRLSRGEGPGTVPSGMLNADITSAATPANLFFMGELSPEKISEREPRARMSRSGAIIKAWGNQEASRATGPEWVYPGVAANGLFRDAVDMVRVRGNALIEEILAR